MAPKRRAVSGLQRLHGEWVNTCLVMESLPIDWAENEAMIYPEPWLSPTPSLHALRRLAILADAGAVRLLLTLSGEDRAKEALIHAAAETDVVAARVVEAARTARAYIATNPCEEAPRVVRSPSSSSCSDVTNESCME